MMKHDETIFQLSYLLDSTSCIGISQHKNTHIISLNMTETILADLNRYTTAMCLVIILGECIALWGEPNELSIQYRIYIFMQYVDS